MSKEESSERRASRVAIALEVEWGFKRHLETYAGCLRYAYDAGWECAITPNTDQIITLSEGERGFDGVLARATNPMTMMAKKAGVPIVNVWLNSPAVDLPSVYADFEESGRMAAEHLVGRGFKRFGYLGFVRELDSRRQIKGFRQCLESAGFNCSEHRFSRTGLQSSAPTWSKFREDLKAWLDSLEPPVGIFVSNDLYCRYLMDACRAKGLHISQDIAIIGTSNEPNICNSPYPTLTSIDLGFENLGYRAAAMLDRLMKGEPPPEKPELVKPKGLVPRQSTDAFAVEDPLISEALRFIAENCHQRIHVPDVASAVALNRRSLERRFREHSDRSIAEEITRMRLERAKRHISETSAPLKAIAVDCGFRNSDHLCKVFKRSLGQTPLAFKKQHALKSAPLRAETN